MFFLFLSLACVGGEPLSDTAAVAGDSAAALDSAAPEPELWDGVDNNGDGVVDEGFDEDGDGVTTCGGDCDDSDPFVLPGAADVCDGVDNDCSGSIDEAFDLDGDGDSECGLDCDDGDPAVSGHLPEICDGQDNDCDEDIDEGFDEDGDGVPTCRGDCDDQSADTYPGAEEICDGQVNGCGDDQLDEAVDNDGDGYSICEGDCDDREAAAFEGAEEVCDGVDNNCDGAVDEFAECYGCVASGDYLWCAEEQSWADARDACVLLGYHLITIDDAAENALAAGLAGSDSAWIGFNDIDEEGVFTWADGSPASYTSWNSGEPNNAGGEDCTQINYSVVGGWNDYPCSAEQPFLCER